VFPSRSSADPFLRKRSFELPLFFNVAQVVSYLLVQVMGDCIWTQSRRVFAFRVLVLRRTHQIIGVCSSLFAGPMKSSLDIARRNDL
jgi:hypothetical protein